MIIDPDKRRPAAECAFHVFNAALNAVDGGVLVARHARADGEAFWIGDEPFTSETCDRVFLVGAGKAACAMARPVIEAVGSLLAHAVVVTKHGHGWDVPGLEVLEAGHPVPDAGSVAAGEEILRICRSAGPDDLVVCVLSGGASALMEAPRAGLSLADIQEVTSLLLREGAPIGDLNAVRACLSDIKAGGLARATRGELMCLVLSDVIGNDLEVIGSAPCLPMTPDPARATEVLRRYGLLDRAPSGVLRALEAGQAAGGRSERTVPHIVVGDLWTAVRAAEQEANRLKLKPAILSRSLEGEAREVGHTLGAIARDLPALAKRGGPNCYIMGGETTVTVRGNGKGGRCQEIACAAALAIDGTENIGLVAAGTDGTDGPTDATGAVVDGTTATSAGRDTLLKALEENDTYPALDAADALLFCSPTDSNVGDLVIMVTLPQT